MAFNNSTRIKKTYLGSITKVGTGASTQSLVLPKVGLLARLYLTIRGTITGSLSAPNALGLACIINRVRLRANNGIDIFSTSGAGYQYLLRDYIETELIDPLGQNNSRDAVTAVAAINDMIIPVQMNLRDPLGLIMLQNEQTQVTLEVEFLADASAATGATVPVTIDIWMEYFTVPVRMEDWPPLNLVHQILEDTIPVTSGTDATYNWPRGNTYLQVLHGLGIGATGADSWSRARLRVNQSDYLDDITPNMMDVQYRMNHGRARELGVVAFDLLGSSGLGSYGLTRDFFNSALVTDLATVITPTATTTLYTVRRQLVPLQ